MRTAKTTPPVVSVSKEEVLGLWDHTAAAHLPLVVRVDDIAAQRVEDIPHCHRDFFALYVVQKGRGTHVIEGTPYGISRGDVYVMGMGMTHTYRDCDSLVLDALYFTPQVFDPPTLRVLRETPGFLSLFVAEPWLRAPEGGGRWLHLTPDVHAAITDQIAELRREWASGTSSGALLTPGLFLRLLVHLARHYTQARASYSSSPLPCEGEGPGVRAAASPGAEATVAAAVRYMDEHFSGPLRIEQVAASVFLSADRFTEVFATAMGRTPRDYLRHLRLERAKTLLTTTDLSVADIAQRAGFGEASYFTRAFKAATGLPPRLYRQRPG